MHGDFAISGAEDLRDQIAHRNGLFPPAFFSGANGAGGPDIGVLIRPLARAPRHGAE
jgi:hypothetical protein